MTYQNIPLEMRVFNQWIVWRYEDVDGKKPTKVPYSPNNGRMASVVDPDTWSSFDNALHALKSGNWYSGLGFVLTESDPYTFIDLDDPNELKPDGTFKNESPQAVQDRQIKIYQEFDSYAERSPSGKGLHIICKGRVESGRKRGAVEIYSSARYMTMTGDVYRDKPITEHHNMLQGLWSQMAKTNSNVQHYMGLSEATETDQEIIDSATKAANGDKFTALYGGNWQDLYQSQSDADMALVDIIAFYSKNKQQITRIFLASGLGQREKAKRVDYMGYMLNKCFDNMLPPPDIEGLRDQVNEAIAKANANKQLAPSLATAPAEQPATFEMHQMPETYSLPPGLLGEIAQFIYAQAPSPVPEIALAGAIGFMSGIVGRSYNVSATGLNQYVLLLAPTGTGKEAIASGIDKLLNAVIRSVPSAGEFVGPAEIASPQALNKYLANTAKSFVSLVGEFGIALQQMSSVNAPPHLVGLRRMMLDLYNKSGEGKLMRPSIYSDKDKNTLTVQSPSFTLLGESTPEKFYEALHDGMISEGLLPRFTTIEYKGIVPKFNETHHLAQPSFELIDRLSTLCAHSQMLNSQHKAIHVQQDEATKALLVQFREHCRLKVNSTTAEVKKHLWTRSHMKALKLAAVIAVGCNPYDPLITTEIANWAITLVMSDTINLLQRFDSGEVGVDNDETKQLHTTAKVIKDYVTSPWADVCKYAGESMGHLHSARIVPFSYLSRRLAAISVFKKDRQGATTALKRAMKTLTERGDLQEVSRATMSKDYNTTAVCYAVHNPKAFGL